MATTAHTRPRIYHVIYDRTPGLPSLGDLVAAGPGVCPVGAIPDRPGVEFESPVELPAGGPYRLLVPERTTGVGEIHGVRYAVRRWSYITTTVADTD